MARNLYLDSDGVLADFDVFILELFGKTGPELKNEIGEAKLWDRIHSVPNFFQRLPKMPGADRLVDGVRHLSPIILTGVHEGDRFTSDAADKTIWAARNFPGLPIIPCLSEEKCKHISHSGDVLVDDRVKYRHLWEDAGGVFVHYQNPEQALSAVFTLFPR